MSTETTTDIRYIVEGLHYATGVWYRFGSWDGLNNAIADRNESEWDFRENNSYGCFRVVMESTTTTIEKRREIVA